MTKIKIYELDDLPAEKVIEILQRKANYDKKKREQPTPVLTHTGDCCQDCGSINLLRTGTCAVCSDCGSSQGCS